MSKLKDVLDKYSVPPPHFGPAGGTQTSPALNLADLRTDLQRVSQGNTVYFNLCFIAVAILFLAECALILVFLNDLGKLSAIFAAAGVGIFGLVRQMTSLWREKAKSDVV